MGNIYVQLADIRVNDPTCSQSAARPVRKMLLTFGLLIRRVDGIWYMVMYDVYHDEITWETMHHLRSGDMTLYTTVI